MIKPASFTMIPSKFDCEDCKHRIIVPFGMGWALSRCNLQPNKKIEGIDKADCLPEFKGVSNA